MVKILKYSPLLDHIKFVYDKPLWQRAKYLWKQLEEHNPVLAFFSIPAGIFTVSLGTVTTYCRVQERGQPKYYEYVVVMRPDDPRVPHIRHDDSLGIACTVLNRMLHMAT